MAKSKLKILRVPEFIKKPHDSLEAAAEFVQFLRDALAELSHSSSRSSSATAHAGLILQAIAWLCRAQVHATDSDALTRLHGTCSKALRALEPALQSGALSLEQLRPLLLPCPEDGATPEIVYCFGLWARWLALTSDTAKTQAEEIVWWKQAGSLQLAWYQLYSTARLYSSSRTGPRGVWLHRPLLRLLARLVAKALITDGPVGPVMSVHGLTVVRLGMISAAARPSGHPGLQQWLPSSSSSSSMSPQQLQVSGANVEAMLQQQELWWSVAAMCLATLTICIKPQQARPLQPARHCPDYNHTVPADFVKLKTWAEAVQECCCVLLDLLLAEVWWLWPWQLQVLEAGAAKAEAAAAGSSSSRTVASIAARVAESGAGSAAAAADPSHWHALNSTSGSSSGSSSRTSSSKQQQQIAADGPCGTDQGMTFQVPVLLTPYSGVGSNVPPPPKVALGPVTRQQLQQMVAMMAHGGEPLPYQAGLLLALLLQRADPGLRAAFLNGPEASLLLAALLDLTTWEEWQDFGRFMPDAFCQAGKRSWETAREVLLGAWEGSEFRSEALNKPSVALLLVALCYLQPCAPQQQQQQQQQKEGGEGQEQPQQRQQQQQKQPVEQDEQQQEQQPPPEQGQEQQQQGQHEEQRAVAVDWGVPHAVTTGARHGVVLLGQLPHTHMELVPGVAPTALLIGTIEAAVRLVITIPRDEKPDLDCVPALVSACCRALMQQSSGGSSSSSAGGCSTRNGKGGGSSSSSGGSSNSTSSSREAGAGARAGVVQALADLAVTGRTECANLKPLVLQADAAGLFSNTRHLCCWAGVAADLLQLAAHEVAAGRAGRATLALAVAAQDLASCFIVLARRWAVKAGSAVQTHVLPGAAVQKRRVDAILRVAAGRQGVLAQLGALEAAVSSMLSPVSAAAPGVPSTVAAEALPAQAAAPMDGATQQQQQQQEEEEGEEIEEEEEALWGSAVVLDSDAVVTPDDAAQVASVLQALKTLRSTRIHFATRNLQLQLAGCSAFDCCKGLTACTSGALVVGRKGVRCGGCGMARYCCPEHQKDDWPQHRHVCGRLARAKAAAASSNSGNSSSRSQSNS